MSIIRHFITLVGIYILCRLKKYKSVGNSDEIKTRRIGQLDTEP